MSDGEDTPDEHFLNRWTGSFEESWKKWRSLRVASLLLLAGSGFGLGVYFQMSLGLVSTWEKVFAFGSASAGLILTSLAIFNGVLKLEIADRTVQALNRGIGHSDAAQTAATDAITRRVTDMLDGVDSRGLGHIEDREKHWTKEKEFLADKLAKFLGDRVQQLLNARHAKVILLFDSGSTISPLMDTLARRTRFDGVTWTQDARVRIVTNNIAGAMRLLRYRKRDAVDDRHSEIPFECELLPGSILSAYAATASKKTVAAITALRPTGNVDRVEPTEGPYIIAITTGNYLLYERTGQVCPIARAGMHPRIKVAMAKTANEIYYVGPLGKVLRAKDGEDLEETRLRFNKVLKLEKSAGKLEERSYYFAVPGYETGKEAIRNREVESAASVLAHKTILVTTTRPDKDYILYDHGEQIGAPLLNMTANLEVESVEKNSTPRKLTWVFGDEALPKSPREQFNVELPHEYLRSRCAEYLPGVKRPSSVPAPPPDGRGPSQTK